MLKSKQSFSHRNNEIDRDGEDSCVASDIEMWFYNVKTWEFSLLYYINADL